MNKKKIIVLILAILVIIVFVLFRIISLINTSKNEVSYVSSIVEKQKGVEEDFESEGYTFDSPNVILNPYGNSPLTAFDEGKIHYIPIYGLYAGRENEVVISNGDEENTLKIKTDELPDDFVLPTKVTKDESKLTNDLYFFSPSSKGYMCAYDVNGDVRWYLDESAIWEVNRLKNGHLLLSTERLVNTPYYSTGLYEMDMIGKVYTEYSLPGGYHHDYFEMEDGNILVASDDFDNEDGTVEDYVVELDRETGNIVKTFDLKDILNMEDGKSENWTNYDWFHNNSVWYDKKTNSITLSGRHQDIVINIDYDSGKLNWILGDSTNFSEEYQKYFFKLTDGEWQWAQHAAMILPDGNVFLFDNGNNKSKNKDEYVSASESYSRGVIYEIDTENMTAKEVWQYGKERGSDFYSPYISDVDYLDENHYIVHSGGISYKNDVIQNQPAGISESDTLVSDTVEIIDNEVIFEMVLPTNNYRVEKMSLYDGNFTLGKAKELGGLGLTELDDQKFSFMMNGKSIDDEYKKHDIKITQEKDRLVVTGTFKKGTPVNIILYKDMTQNIYSMRVSKTPYTALCVDLGNNSNDDENITATKYINKSGLIGKYSIYIEIDGTLYKTDKYARF